jgi:hypothetical protein
MWKRKVNSVAYKRDYGNDVKKMPRFVAPPGTIRRNNRGDAGTTSSISALCTKGA